VIGSARDVCIGSIPDLHAAEREVRFAPLSTDIISLARHVRKVPAT